jgi:hypothetical protein
MCRKSPAVNYVFKKFSTTRKSMLYHQLKDYPLSVYDYTFACDMINKLSIKDLCKKYYKSPSRISQWKREVCEKIHAFDVANIRR